MTIITNKIFLERAFLIHGNKYEYLSEYESAKTKVKIFCKKCNFIFEQTPSNHISNKRGCPKCSFINSSKKQSKTNEQFLSQAKQVHGNKFQYLSEYKNNRTLIKMKCLNCENVFSQMATNHIDKKCGCPNCNRFVGYSLEKFSKESDLVKNKPAKLYLYRFQNMDEEFYKVGITTSVRVFGVENIYDIKLVSEVKTTLYDAILMENKFISDFKDYKYIPKVKFKGYTECFKKEISKILW